MWVQWEGSCRVIKLEVKFNSSSSSSSSSGGSDGSSSSCCFPEWSVIWRGMHTM